MDKIIEELVKLVPLAPILEQWGLSKDTSTAISFILLALIIYGLIRLYANVTTHYKNTQTAKDLFPYFDYQKVKSSRDLFIPTQWQQFSPTHEEEPSHSGSYVVQAPLIRHFLKTAFDEKKDNQKFYLVLADSGMGKTTFMINLYVQYNSFFNFNKKYKIKLLPFGDARILDHIKEIKPEDAKNTILLLDAFDEYKGLLPPEKPDGLTDDLRFRLKLDEIIETVRDFRDVVITSRTQYFPGQENKPYELDIKRFDEKGFHTLAKLYISPFSNEEIKKYLNKKYGILKFWNWKKKEIAQNVVNNSPKLMVRPMLLSYIDYFVEDNRTFKNTYEIYDTLIEKWIDREATKRKHTSTQRERFKDDLYNYSRFVALEIFNKRKESGLYYLPKSEVIEVAEKNYIGLRDYEITGQSLLTRDVVGNWKFAHKSIFEFFIAKEASTTIGMTFLANLDFTGMDMAKLFSLSIVQGFMHIKGGIFLMGSPQNEQDRHRNEEQHIVKVNDFSILKHPITVQQFEIFVNETGYITDAERIGNANVWDAVSLRKQEGLNWSNDEVGKIRTNKAHPVIYVSWNDANSYCEWLNKDSAITVRLPTEAEWEYACRAGTETSFNTGNYLSTEQSNFNGHHSILYTYPQGKYLGGTTPVGNYAPNQWGLYDMHGNVSEWCNDWYDENYYNECQRFDLVDNPKGAKKSLNKILRGGSWNTKIQYCRSAHRGNDLSVTRNNYTGFRIVFVS